MIYMEDTSGPVRVLVANGKPIYEGMEAYEAMIRAMETRRRLDSKVTTQEPIPSNWKVPKTSGWQVKHKARTSYFTWGGARPGAGRPRKESNAR